MKLYDKLIGQIMEIIGNNFCSLEYDADSKWEDAGDMNLILKSDMAYELGAMNSPAVSGMFFTSDANLVPEDAIWLCGSDLDEIKSDTPYARLTLVRINDSTMKSDGEIYSAMRKVEYTRYHINPKGYMMRISAASQREPVRISKSALADGLTFQKVGSMFVRGYHESTASYNIEAVKMIFITLADFPYDRLEHLAHKGEEITNSLNHIFNNLVMDCSVCNLKPVCDEVEGMREIHMAAVKN